MFTGLHHVNIVVSDIERSKKFYTEVLGMQVTIETEIEGPEFLFLTGSEVVGVLEPEIASA